MAGNNQFIYGHYDCGSKYVDGAKKQGAATRQHGTSHCVVTVMTGPYAGDSMPVPIHELGRGLSHKIWKWFVKVGLICMLLLSTVACIVGATISNNFANIIK